MELLIKKYPYENPKDNLEHEEHLLKNATNNKIILGLWEAKQDFVILGKSNKAKTEVLIKACQKDKIPIIKRCSGGGTILQTKGVLNYAFIAPHSPPFDTIKNCNIGIMNSIKEALTTPLYNFKVQGDTDLTYKGKKCTGNAQKRSLTHFLFHGCFLITAELDKISQYLKHPSKEPSYRKKIKHKDFLCNCPLNKEQVIQGLKKAGKQLIKYYQNPETFKVTSHSEKFSNSAIFLREEKAKSSAPEITKPD